MPVLTDSLPAALTATVLPPRPRKPWAEDALPLVIEWYQDRKAEGFSENTCINYAFDLKNLAGFLTAVPLEDATPADLRAYRRSLLSRNLAMSTCSRTISAVRTFYNWLRIRNELAFSPAQDLKPPRRPDHVHRWWTAKEVAQFRRAFKGDDPTTLRDRALIELGLIGLRLSEAVGLDLNRVLDLNTKRAAIIVRRKGGKEQVLPLSPAAREALQAWLKVRPSKDTDAVFFRIPHQPSRPRLTRLSVRKILSRYVLAAGLKLQKGQSFHLLRHTFGQRMADTGVSLAEAQAVLGHSNPKTTLVYYTVSNTQLRKTMSRLSY